MSVFLCNTLEWKVIKSLPLVKNGNKLLTFPEENDTINKINDATISFLCDKSMIPLPFRKWKLYQDKKLKKNPPIWQIIQRRKTISKKKKKKKNKMQQIYLKYLILYLTIITIDILRVLYNFICTLQKWNVSSIF